MRTQLKRLGIVALVLAVGLAVVTVLVPSATPKAGASPVTQTSTSNPVYGSVSGSTVTASGAQGGSISVEDPSGPASPGGTGHIAQRPSMYTSTDPSTGGLQLWHIAYSGGTHVYKLTLPTGYHLLQVGAAVAITSVGSPSKLTYNNIYGWISPPHAVDRSFQHAIVATQHVTDSAGSAQNTGRYLAVTVWAPPSTSFPVLVDPQVTFGYYVYLHFFSGDIDNFWGTFFSYGTGVAFAVMCAPFGIVGAVLCGLAGTYWGNAIGNAFWNAAQTTCQRAGYVPDLLADYGWIAPGPLDVATIFGWGIWFGAIHCGVVIKFDDVFPTPVGIIPNVSDSWGQ